MGTIDQSPIVPKNEPKEDPAAIVDNKLDAALTKAGSWGRWQLFMVIMISSSQIFSAIHCVAAVFLSATLKHRCQLPITFEDEKSNTLLESVSFPNESSNCQIFSHDYAAIGSHAENGSLTEEQLKPYLNNETVECESWVYESEYYESSVMSEWNLVCSRKFLKATVQATFMAGILLGSAFYGQVSDRIGRRRTILFCSLALVTLSIGVAFVQTYLGFVILRFLVALHCAGLMVTQFVLIIEITNPEARTFTGMLDGIPFGLGISAVGCIAYFLRDWRSLELGYGIVSGFTLVYFCIVPESPRWLVTKGRHDEALSILKSIAKWNKKTLPSDEEMMTLLKSSEPEQTSTKSGCARCLSFLRDQVTLVRTPVMRRRCLISFFLWFASAMIYYGLIFFGAEISNDPYLMIIVSGLLEVPSFALTSFGLYKFGRRTISCSLFFICGFFVLCLLGVPKEQAVISFILTNLGKFFNTSVFQLCYLYTSELVPTNVRNVAVGTSSMFGRIGSSTAPYIIDGLGEIHSSLPLAVFGILSLVAGLLTLFLPETMNEPLPQTVEEVEAQKK